MCVYETVSLTFDFFCCNRFSWGLGRVKSFFYGEQNAPEPKSSIRSIIHSLFMQFISISQG